MAFVESLLNEEEPDVVLDEARALNTQFSPRGVSKRRLNGTKDSHS